MLAGMVSVKEGDSVLMCSSKGRLGHRKEITTQNFASAGKMISILPSFVDLVICIFSYKLQGGMDHTGDKCRMASSCCSGEQADT